MEITEGSYYDVYNLGSTMTISNIGKNMTVKDYLLSAHLSAQQHYHSVRLMSVRIPRKQSELLTTVAEMTNLPPTYKLSYDICGEVLISLVYSYYYSKTSNGTML